MPLTPEEITQIQEGLTAGNYSENENIRALAGLGFKIRTEAEETAFVQNQEKAVADRKTLEFATNIEKDILETTGIEKKPNEKYHEYLKRAGSELKAELTTLKEKNPGQTSEADKKRITELEALVQTKEADFNKTLSELKGSYAKEKVGNTLQSAVDAIKPTLKKNDYLDDIVTARLGRFNSEYKAEINEAGQTVFIKNADGKTALDTKTGNPLTANELLTDFFKDLKEPAPGKKEGAGSGKTGGTGGSGTGADLDIPAEVKTKGDLAVWFKKNSGLTVGSKEYNEAYKKYSDALPLK